MVTVTKDSCDTVSIELYKSLQESGIDNLLEFLSKQSEAERFLPLNQQRGEPDLTVDQKLSLLRTQLEKSPSSFLFQFGKYLNSSHLDYFKTIRHQHYDVDFYLSQMEKPISVTRAMQIKNRRYEALQKLVDTTDYFTEEEMQRRNPILFNQLIGRYHSKEEREAFLFQSSKSSSSKNIDPARRPTPLTDMFIAHMRRADGFCSDRRIDQEMQIQEENQAEKHSSKAITNHNSKMNTNSKDDMESDSDTGSNEEYEMDHDNDEEHVPEIDEAEKDLLKEEFFTTMYRDFLDGKDEDFNYETVDDNADYDVGETLVQDQEEKYFDADEDDAAKPLSIESEDVAPPPVQPLKGQMELEESEEDELDAYMKGIEEQLELQKQFTF